jgi:hypothetical protein
MSRRRKDRPKRPLHASPLAANVLLVTPAAPPEYDPARHNYIRKQATLIGEGVRTVSPGRASRVEVAHDPWCALLVWGGYCDCDPEIRPR